MAWQVLQNLKTSPELLHLNVDMHVCCCRALVVAGPVLVRPLKNGKLGRYKFCTLSIASELTPIIVLSTQHPLIHVLKCPLRHALPCKTNLILKPVEAYGVKSISAHNTAQTGYCCVTARGSIAACSRTWEVQYECVSWLASERTAKQRHQTSPAA